ncbi:hybrid sensor histidine kinase/response regulator [Halovulum dunhuangense]|nr:ATP-binding protein [Halovulum dunhuangense]
MTSDTTRAAGLAAALPRDPLYLFLPVAWGGLGAAWLGGAPSWLIVALWVAGGLATALQLQGAGRAAPVDPAFGPALFRLSRGRVLRPRNRVARRMAGLGPDLFATLAGGVEGGSAALFRMGQEAERKGHAEVAARFWERAYRLSAARARDGGQHWRLEPVGPPGPAAMLPSDESAALEDLPVAVVRLDADGKILAVNAAARRLLGEAALPGVALPSILEGMGKPMTQRLRETMAGQAQGRSEVARCHGADSDGFLQVVMTRCEGACGPSILAVLSDATQLKTLEAQFVQSQKMQAVGQLAGGIAHDFNNLLTAINGHCDLLLLRHLQGDGDHADLMQIRQNANRAAALVRQLLAFSRKQTLRPQTLHLYDTLAELANLLNRLLGEKFTLRIRNSEDIWPVRVDERQLEQVIVNLVVNARDAMPDGGVVSLETRRLSLDAPSERDRAIIPPGDYAVITVEDSGVGIPRDRLGKIFEPFYTTKRAGEGTGLGLSTAYGIIKQMDGFIFVESEPGVRTRFEILLPRSTSEPGADADAPPAVPAVRRRESEGQGVVLLVEDEAPVRAFAARALQLRGFTVIEAESGEAALELLEDRDLRVDLFVSDVVMPGLDGPSWVRRAYQMRPTASTVFVSGYSMDMFSDTSELVPRSSYLPKPFTLNDLIERVRDHMDRYAA